MSSPLVAALTRLSCEWHSRPLLLTVSQAPVSEVFAHVFGEAQALNAVLAEDGGVICVRSADGADPLGSSLPHGSVGNVGLRLLLLAGDGLILRFVDPMGLRLVERLCPELLVGCAVVWLEMTLPADQSTARMIISRYGLTYSLGVPPHTGILLGRNRLEKERTPNYAARRASTFDKLVIVENNLTGDRGHYLPVVRRIVAGAIEAGLKVVVGCHERLEDDALPAQVVVERVFGTSIFDISLDRHETLDLSADVLAGWRQLVRSHPEQSTHFLVPTTDGHHVRAAYRLMIEDLGIPGIIHLCTPYETRHMAGRNSDREVDWYLTELSRLPSFGTKLFLWTETHALASIYTDRVSPKVRVLPLPAALVEDNAGSDPNVTDLPLVFAFLGEAREDKGFLRLPEIVSCLLSAAPVGSIEVFVQLSPPFGGFSPEMVDVCNQLELIDGVHVAWGTLSDVAYKSIMQMAFALLLPYRSDYYRARGSGLLVEALSYGKVILGSADTILEEFRGDGEVVLCREPTAWGHAAQTLVKERELRSSSAQQLAKRFRQRFGPRGFIDRLAQRADCF